MKLFTINSCLHFLRASSHDSVNDALSFAWRTKQTAHRNINKHTYQFSTSEPQNSSFRKQGEAISLKFRVYFFLRSIIIKRGWNRKY